MTLAPDLAQDQSYQVLSQNSKIQANILQGNWNGDYPSAKLHRKREDPCLDRALDKFCQYAVWKPHQK